MRDTYSVPCPHCGAAIWELCRVMSDDLDEFGWIRKDHSTMGSWMVQPDDGGKPISEWLEVPHPSRIAA